MQYQYSESQNKTRNDWLLATKIFFLGWGFANCILMTIHYMLDNNQTRQLFQGIYSLISACVSFYFVRQYAYIKNGTRLLTFSIITCGLSYLLFPFYVKTLSDAALWSVSFIVYIWWVWLGTKMKPINVGVQFWQQSYAAFEEQIKAFNGAKSGNDLDSLYQKAIKKWPAFAPQAEKVYEKTKTTLKADKNRGEI